MPDFYTMVVLKNPGALRGFPIPRAVADLMQDDLGCKTAGSHNKGLRWETADGIGVVHFEIRDTVRHLYILPSGSPSWKDRSTLENMLRNVGLTSYTSKISSKPEIPKNPLKLTDLTWEEVYEVAPFIVFWSYEQQTRREHPTAARFLKQAENDSAESQSSKTVAASTVVQTSQIPHLPPASVPSPALLPLNISEESSQERQSSQGSSASEGGRLVEEHRVIDVMRSAAGCNYCFDTIAGLQRVQWGLPKPRWIGSRYSTACPRVVVVLLNPGDSSGLGEEWNHRERNHFDAFFENDDYDQVRDYFRTRREEELNGTTSAKPVFSWYESVLGLVFEDIAQVNMAWCASVGNNYRKMLQPCFERGTADAEPRIYSVNVARSAEPR